MIDVSAVVSAPEMAQSFTIQRSNGSFLNGTWISQTTNLQGFGVISVATPNDILMTPQGDIIKGDMVFHSENPIYTTSAEHGRSSDILIWRGNQYRVLTVGPFVDYGYFRAVGVRLKAAG